MPVIRRAPVREIVARVTPPVPWESPVLPMREHLGRKVHARFAESFPGSESEVDIKGEYHSNEGDVLLIHGRIDCLTESENRLTVTEVKSVQIPDSELVEIEQNSPARYSLQAMVYAWLLSKSSSNASCASGDIRCKVALLNLPTDEFIVLDTDWSHEIVEDAFELYLDECRRLEAEQNAIASRRRVLGDELGWVYPDYRPGQSEVMRSVEQAFQHGKDVLVQAPPGFGKTIAMLYPALRHALQRGKPLFFATAKGGGRNAVYQAITKLHEKCPELRVLFLSAREELCLNDKADAGSGFACEYCDLTDQRDDYFGSPGEIQFRDALDELLPTSPVDAEVLRRLGERRRICPVILSREILTRVDVVVGDYNFIFDPGARLPLFRDPKPNGWTLLIDEAHNLFDRARDIYSTTLHLELVRHTLDLLRHDGWRYEHFPSYLDLCSSIEDALERIQRSLESLPENNLVLLDGEEFFWGEFPDRLGEALAIFLIDVGDALDEETGEALWELYGSVRYLADLLYSDRESYPFVADSGESRLQVGCLDPSEALSEILSRFSAVAAFSGTLTPLSWHRNALGFTHRPVEILDVAEIFQSGRQRVLLARNIDTRYVARGSTVERVADTIMRFCLIKPGGYLAVFPSFEYIQQALPHLRHPSVDVLVQERRLTVEGRRSLRSGLEKQNRTTLAVIVAGGQFSEAEDYPGDACIGVIVVGPCLPPSDPWKETLKLYWYRRGDDGMGVAYFYPAVRRVVQAAGRMVRKDDDRGTILLLDDRFQESHILPLLPLAWREQLGHASDDWERDAREFWEMLDSNDSCMT